MPFKKIKDGKVIEEQATKSLTPEQAEKNKLKEIDEQKEQREVFLKDREAGKQVAEQTSNKASSGAPQKPAAS